MKIARNLGLAAFAASMAIGAGSNADAQAIAPPYTDTFTLTTIGAIGGIPGSYGGIGFAPGDNSHLIVGANANGSSGVFYSVPVTRNLGQHIIGFGTPTAFGFGGYNDGGLTWGPNGALLYRTFPANEIHQVKSGSNADTKTVTTSFVTGGSGGGLLFVPYGFNGAGRLKLADYSSGLFYDLTYSSDGSGGYNITGATAGPNVGSPEAFVYVQNAPHFTQQSALLSDYSDSTVKAYAIDSTGNPTGAGTTFISGLSGVDGATIDPVTGDFLFSTYNNQTIVRVQGFTPPPVAAAPVPTLGEWAMLAMAGLMGLVAMVCLRRRNGGSL